jgi:hypothetical protein
VQFLKGFGVKAQILLATDENDREAGAEVEDFGDPLLTQG